MNKPTLRLYTFINYYLSPIQAGIQSAHLVHELFNEYELTSSTPRADGKSIIDWSADHKTIIVLNGGNHKSLMELFGILLEQDLPWVSFNEDDASLGGLMTGIGVVLPDYIYEAKSTNNSSRFQYEYTDLNSISVNSTGSHRYLPGSKIAQLLTFMNNCRLF